MNQCSSPFRVANMWPHGSLNQFLGEDAHNTIENSRRHEKVSNRFSLFALKWINVVQESQTNVLLYVREFLLIMEYELFQSPSFHLHNFTVVYVPFPWCSDSIEVVGEAESFFSRHDAVCFVTSVFFFFQTAKCLTWEHAAPVVLIEDSVAADILIVLGGDALTIDGPHNTSNVQDSVFVCWLLWLHQVIWVFCEFGC